MKLNKYSVFGLNYCATNYDEASDVIIEKAKARNSFTVAALPVHGLVESYLSEKFHTVANHIDMVVPDGHPVVWALNTIHKVNLKRPVCGADLALHVLDKANRNKLNVFLFGSYEHTIHKFAGFIRETYPDITICGIQSDRFRDSTEEEDKKDIELINSSGANIVLVGRGCPRQEYWIDAHKDKINAAMLAIGGAFDWHAKTVKRAPLWMRKLALEWLFRLAVEPRRLWKRYLITNTVYIFLMTKFNLKAFFNKVFFRNKK